MTEAINYESMMQMNLDFASANPVMQEMDAVEILVSMAKTGKINPWSVDIVDITDKYLAHMFKMKAQNLKVTGRTLLFAAILLRLKSNILEGVDISEFEQNDMEDEFFDDEFQADYDVEDEINTNNVISIDNSEIYDKIKRLEDKIQNGAAANTSAKKAVVDEITSRQFNSPVADEPQPNVDLRNVKQEELVDFAEWNEVLAELERINPAVVGSLADSQAKTVGNVIFVIAKNRFFITLFKNKENVMSLNEAIFNVTGKHFAIKAKYKNDSKN